MKMREGLLQLRYNQRTGKWYKDNPTKEHPWRMTVYFLSDNVCPICKDRFFYCSGNPGNYCSESCSTTQKNYNNGISKETAIKIGLSNKGKRRTIEQKEQMKFRPQCLKLINGEWNPMWNPESVEKRRLGVIKSGVYSGKNNPNWQNGLSLQLYPRCFNNTLRVRIKTRDNYICQNPFCDNISGSLQVHHIDHNKNNNNEKNLITLCQRCNLQANYEKRDFYVELYQQIQEHRYIV